MSKFYYPDSDIYSQPKGLEYSVGSQKVNKIFQPKMAYIPIEIVLYKLLY